MTTMISNLPRDLIEDIISRIPWKSMKAVRLTCKSWNNLCKSESFTKMHIGKAKPIREGETMMIATTGHNIYLMSVDVGPSIELKGQLRFLHNQVNVSNVFHYEGLVLCILKDICRIVVWNPYLGQTRWIELRCSHHPQGYDEFNYILGYGDKDSCRNVKLLRFVDYFYEAPESQFFWYEMYDFDSGLWTTLDVTPHWGISFSTPSVSLKGNTYCRARERSSKGHEKYIICFDFTRERFGPLLPLPSDARDCGYVYVSLSCVKEEKLAALFQHHYEYEFEIWITTKIDAEMVSWSKFFKIDTERRVDYPITYSLFTDDEENNVYMGFNRGYGSDDDCATPYINIMGDDGYLKKKDIGVLADQKRWPHLCSYVPSLIQIKKPARGKRIKQSSLEKRRFDQNRLRLDAFEKLLKEKENYWWEDEQKEKRDD